jgi:SAM-dependent methyltransferase
MDAQVTTPYEALAAVYDRWTEGNDYDRWADFTLRRFAAADRPVHRVLDLCCGTGAMSSRLRDNGFQVTGVDASAAMIASAKANVAGAEFVTGTLPDVELPAVDAAVCTFDSLNYLAEDGSFAATLAAVGAALAEGGVFVFDLNTRRKLADLFGDSHYGDDLGDFSYVWRNRYDPDTRCVDFLITLFVQEAAVFRRFTERHRQRWFTRDEVTAAATAAGFTTVDVVDDYGDTAAGEQSLRETWVLVKARPC